MEAFLIIDMQEGYIGDKRQTDAFKNTVAHIHYVSDLFRKAGKPVIFVKTYQKVILLNMILLLSWLKQKKMMKSIN